MTSKYNHDLPFLSYCTVCDKQLPDSRYSSKPARNDAHTAAYDTSLYCSVSCSNQDKDRDSLRGSIFSLSDMSYTTVDCDTMSPEFPSSHHHVMNDADKHDKYATAPHFHNFPYATRSNPSFASNSFTGCATDTNISATNSPSLFAAPRDRLLSLPALDLRKYSPSQPAFPRLFAAHGDSAFPRKTGAEFVAISPPLNATNCATDGSELSPPMSLALGGPLSGAISGASSTKAVTSSAKLPPFSVAHRATGDDRRHRFLESFDSPPLRV